jgi:hypothetical protein
MSKPTAFQRSSSSSRVALACSAALLLMAGSAFAGRPLNVDDANVNDKGKGHVEAWVTRAEGISIYSIAPAYAAFEGVEFGGMVARENESRLTMTGVQAKWRITASQDKGCNVGATFGLSRAKVQGFSASGQSLTGLFSCNGLAGGSLHVNLGVDRVSGGETSNRWGLAFERSFGALTPNIEWFGSEGSKPSFNIGLRGMITDTVQLDGSVGRSDGVTVDGRQADVLIITGPCADRAGPAGRQQHLQPVSPALRAVGRGQRARGARSTVQPRSRPAPCPTPHHPALPAPVSPSPGARR